MPARFYIKNGHIEDFEKDTAPLSTFLCGNFMLTEKIWFCHNELPLFQNHMALLAERTKLLKLPPIPLLAQPKELLRVSKRLINKNKAFMSGLLTYLFVWEEVNVETYITCQPHQTGYFPLLPTGLLCTYADNKKYSAQNHGDMAFANELLWETLRLQLQGTPFQTTSSPMNNKLSQSVWQPMFFLLMAIACTPLQKKLAVILTP